MVALITKAHLITHGTGELSLSTAQVRPNQKATAAYLNHEYHLAHAYIIGHYNPLVSIIDLVSHITFVESVNFIHEWTCSLKSTPNIRFFEKFFMSILFTLRVFARNLLTGTRRKNIFIFSFSFLTTLCQKTRQ